MKSIHSSYRAKARIVTHSPKPLFHVVLSNHISAIFFHHIQFSFNSFCSRYFASGVANTKEQDEPFFGEVTSLRGIRATEMKWLEHIMYIINM